MVAPMSLSLGAMGSLLRKRTRREIMLTPMSSSLGAMGPLLRKFESLLAADCRMLPKQLKNRIKRLRTDLLEDIITPLVELSKVQAPDLPAKYWITEVRELSYDLEDSIDEMTLPTCTDAGSKIRTMVRRHWVGSAKIARLPKTLKRRTRIAKVAQLRTTLVWEAIERYERYLQEEYFCSPSSKFGKTSASSRRVPRLKIARLPRAAKWCAKGSKMTSHGTVEWEPNEEHERYQQLDGCSLSSSRQFITTQHLFGIDDQRIQLVDMLKDEAKQNLNVVSIVGSGGIGKTTLAKELYRELGGEFECRAFVRASRKPNMRWLLWSILAQIQLHQLPSRACTVQHLIDNISRHLQEKRYLIIVDDLWHTTVWDIVVSAFPDCYNFSRIITTTEIVDVALECCGFQSDYIFKMKSLGNNDSRRLFFNIVFGSEHRSHKQLEEVSYEITRKCDGLPLATVNAASLVKILSSQPKKSEAWSHIQNFVSSTLTTNHSSEEMMKEILYLSYNCLPQYLKTCLLYLSLYPEGYTILKADLVKQWIAEGFIVATQGKNRKEVAESYFNELINRSMIHSHNMNYIDGVLSCTVHPVVLDIIKCKSKEENFTTVIDYPQIITRLSTKVRRLCLQLSSAKHATKLAGTAMSQVRSLSFFGLHECMPPIGAFEHLRVLILEIWGDHSASTRLDLTRIRAMFHLRYLKITCDGTVELPDQMIGLQHLETLEVGARVSAVPLDIIHLPRMLHLCLKDVTSLPDGIGRMKYLHTLQYFDLGNNSEQNIWSLGELTNLRELHLTCSTAPSDDHLRRNLAALASSLGKLGSLNSITLAPCASGAGISLEGPSIVSSPPVFIRRLELLPPICMFSRLPKWFGKLRMLRVLKVVVRELLTNDYDTLGGLPALIVLSMHVRVARVGTVIIKPTSFPALRYFRFRCRVLCMAFRTGAMRNLQRLKLGFNAETGKQYGRMLGGIEHLLNLQKITGQITTAAGPNESDWRAAASAFHHAIEISRQKWDAMSEHRRFPRVHVKWAAWVLEEAYLHDWNVEEGSRNRGTTVTYTGFGGCDMLGFPVELLPRIISFTSPLDAFRCFAVCTAFRAAATYDDVWDRFFPPDYDSVLSRATDPVDFGFASTKMELFFNLATQPILIDQGYTSFWLDRTSGVKCYMLASRSLHITWGDTPRYWTWISFPDSRFEEVAELLDVCWLDIIATIDCRELSPSTRYAAYLVFNLTDRFYGLDCPTQEACITMAGGVSARHTVSLHPRSAPGRRGRSRGDPQDSQERGRGEEAVKYPRARGDGWMEVEMGDFYNDNFDDGAVEIRLKEHTSLGWKRGLIVEGIEIRQKLLK